MVWIKPEYLLFGQTFWQNERSNRYFILQKRKGHDTGSPCTTTELIDGQHDRQKTGSVSTRNTSTSSDGNQSSLGALFVSTFDAIFDTRPPPYRILYQRDLEDGQIAYIIAVAVDWEEIIKDWDVLEQTIMPVLNALEDNEEELCKFVLSKIEGLLASKNEEIEKNKKLENNLDKNEVKKEESKLLLSSLDGQDEEEDELEQVTNAAILRKFQKLFEMSADEKLVNYYSCSYWKGNKPFQGKLYLSVNFLCFYSFIVGNELIVKLRWTDVLKMSHNNSMLSRSLNVVTKDGRKHVFSVFMNFADAYKHASQLANFAMKQLIEEEGFYEDPSLRSKYLQAPTRKRSQKCSGVTFVKKDLEAKQRTDAYRCAFL
uniref:GRAM domain-containing protein n=1 Tax=Meloidogyne javanica TaxID=6303 RepID=A0A915NFM3_MELJA